MSPSAAQINELYTGLLNQHVQGVQQGKGSAEITDALSLEQILSDDYSFEIAGQEFDLAGRGQGIPAVKEYIATRLFPAILSIYDTNKPMAWEVVRVIGGGESPWATAEIRGTATSKKNRPFIHELIVSIRFDDAGKIQGNKIYMDTLHFQNHISENSK